MATFPVKYIHSDMRGAPQISGTAGTFIAALDAFLITGFGTTTALSVTVQSGIATATLNAGSSFTPPCIVLVEGATPVALNGEQRVLTASNTSITWATTAPDGDATGTITIKVAPVGGWEKSFSGTNLAAYRSTDQAGSRFYLRVDDTGTQSARVRGFESMTDINTGLGAFPSDSFANGGGYLSKSTSANSTSAPYQMAADSRTVLWSIAAGTPTSNTNANAPVRGFGDLIPLAPGGDAYAVGISCQLTADAAGTYYGAGQWGQSDSGYAALFLARAPSGLGGCVTATQKSYVGSGVLVSGSDGHLGAFPSSIDGELKFARCFADVAGNGTPRAELPGVLHIPQSGVSALLDARDIVTGTGAMAGRKLVAALVANGGAATARASCGVALIDITGPWR